MLKLWQVRPLGRNPKRIQSAHSSDTREPEDPNKFGAFMCKQNQNHPIDEWISDSGATQHITGVKSWFTNYREFDIPKGVSLSNKDEAQALGIGTVELEGYVNYKWITCTLSDVLYIPGSVNLFSESVMAQKGYVIIRNREETLFYKNNILGPQAYYKNRLYIIKFRVSQQSALLSVSKARIVTSHYCLHFT